MIDRPRTLSNRSGALSLAVAAIIAAGCASGGSKRPEAAPAVVAAVDAQMRIVASETTWVSLGVGYQIVALSKRDIADVDSSVVHQSKMYNLVFGQYPEEVIVLVTRVSYDRNGYEQAPTPLLPAGTVQQTVDVRLYDGSAPNTAQSQPQQRGRGGRGGYGGRVGGAPAAGTNGARGADAPGGPAADPTEAVTRAWLSARATKLTGHFSTVGANGILSDPRVPVWAESMVPALALDDTTTDQLATELASQPTSVYSLREFFTMARPGTGAYAARGAPGGAAGGMRGGGRGRQGGGNGGQVLTGNALFVAQATVLGKYLTVRQGSPLIGQLVDGQIRGKRITDVLAAQPSGPKDVESLDTDWRNWLRQYGPR